MNPVAIVIAAIANFALGAIWFATPVFGKKWQEWEGRSMTGGNVGAMMGLTGLGALISAIALAWVMDKTSVSTALGGGAIGLYAGIGFLAPAMFADHVFNARKGGLFFIVAGYPVVALLAWARSWGRSADR